MTLELTSIETYSGVFVDLANPREDDIKFIDIAWALSRSTRYAGHTNLRVPYSIAQHSVNVLKHASAALRVDADEREQFRRFISGNADLFDYFESAAWKPYESAMLKHALMHDYAEAYFSDIPFPVKMLIGGVLSPYEQRMDEVIFRKFGLAFPDEITTRLSGALTKFADLYALRIESHYMMHSRGEGWNNPIMLPPTTTLVQWSPPKESMDAMAQLMVIHQKHVDIMS